MGQRVAHLVRGRMRDYIEFEDGYAIARTVPPRSIIGRTLADAAVRDRFGVTVIGIKSPGRDVSHPKPTSVVNEGDLVVVTGERQNVEHFADQQ
jgi:trk system potassium uptake protein TrkA